MSHHIQKPTQLDDVVDHLWYALFGANGHGYAKRLEKLEAAMTALQEMFQTYLKKETQREIEYLKNREEKKEEKYERKKGLRRERIRMILAGAGWFAAGITLLKLFEVF